MNPGFVNQTLDVRTGNGEDDYLLEPLDFIRGNGTVLRAPIGSTTDGLSTPRIIRNLPGYDSTGEDWFSGVGHDAGYRGYLLILPKALIPATGIPDNDNKFFKANFTQKQCDDMILEMMASQGVNIIRRHIIYYALRLFGWIAFRTDRLKSGRQT